MSLAETLPARLQRPFARLLRQLGVPCSARRPEELDDQPDNSTSVQWTKLPGDPTLHVLIDPITEAARQRVWGERVAADAAGTVVAGTIAIGDVLQPTRGRMARLCLKVTAIRPTELAGVDELALQAIPARPDYGF